MDMTCILWTGVLNDQGYGRRGARLAHRVAWEEQYGPIPAGLTIDHMCHDPKVCKLGRECPHRRCVNVEHMALVTGSGNASRGDRHFRNLTTCPQGHPYSGDNLLASAGARHCRTCRRAQLRERRAAAAAARCRTRGHERAEQVAADGRRYCVHCQAAHGRRTSDRRVRTLDGQYAPAPID
jgi:hypothetical protein